MEKQEVNQLLAKGIAVLGAYLITEVAEHLIEENTKQELPKEPEKDNNQSWGKAIAYAALTGAFLGAFKLLVKRGSISGLEKINH